MNDPARNVLVGFNSALKKAWRGWLRVARVIGAVQVSILMGLFYFVIMPAFALAVRWFTDPLGLKRPGSWLPFGATPGIPTLDDARQQF